MTDILLSVMFVTVKNDRAVQKVASTNGAWLFQVLRGISELLCSTDLYPEGISTLAYVDETIKKFQPQEVPMDIRKWILNWKAIPIVTMIARNQIYVCGRRPPALQGTTPLWQFMCIGLRHCTFLPQMRATALICLELGHTSLKRIT